MTTDIPDLAITLPSLLSLISHSLITLQSPALDASHSSIDDKTDTSTAKPIDIYALLHDIATLTKAHATKLGLITTLPFTQHRAASRILLDIHRQIVPSLVSAVQLVQSRHNSVILTKTITDAVKNVLRGIDEFVKSIPIEDAITTDSSPANTSTQKKNNDKTARVKTSATAGSSSIPNKNNYTSTGIIWSACDTLLHISQVHLIGIVEAKLRTHTALLADAILEFREWLDDDSGNTDDSGFEDDVFDSDEENGNGEGATRDEFPEARPKPPPTSNAVKVAGEMAIRKMKMTELLFAAVLKRRMGKTSAAGRTVQEGGEDGRKLDKICDLGREIGESADDVAAAFYDGDLDEGMSMQTVFVQKATALADCCRLSNINQEEDKFTPWFDKFKENVQS